MARLLKIVAEEVLERWHEENEGTPEFCRTATEKDIPLMSNVWKDWKQRPVQSESVLLVSTYKGTFNRKDQPILTAMTWKDLQTTFKTRSKNHEVGMADKSGVNQKTGMLYGADG
jgi:hypothetical protein